MSMWHADLITRCCLMLCITLHSLCHVLARVGRILGSCWRVLKAVMRVVSCRVGWKVTACRVVFISCFSLSRCCVLLRVRICCVLRFRVVLEHLCMFYVIPLTYLAGTREETSMKHDSVGLLFLHTLPRQAESHRLWGAWQLNSGRIKEGPRHRLGVTLLWAL